LFLKRISFVFDIRREASFVVSTFIVEQAGTTLVVPPAGTQFDEKQAGTTSVKPLSWIDLRREARCTSG
jgi:hypothetical protein